jgi:photosystem II stability/assembly factor-like uncharacterized protein
MEILVFALIILPCINVHSQQIPIQIVQKNILNENSTFFDVQKVVEEYWKSENIENGKTYKDGREQKVPNWKLYKRWEYYWEQRVDQHTGQFPQTTAIEEYAKYVKLSSGLKKEKTFNENWTNLGTSSSTGGYAGLGRINCIAFHPSDNNTFWVGSPSGGIWKTTNGGSSWAILNDNQSVIGVSEIVIPSDYVTTNTIYIATGDRDGGSLWSLNGGQGADNASIGILKSTNGGVTWTTTGLTYTQSQKKKVYSVIVHPTNTSLLLASTSDGIYKTTNAGTTWTLKSSWPGWRIAFKPGDPTTVYGTETYMGSQWFQKSTNTGDNWTDFEFGSGSDAFRTELAVTPADANVVYLLTCNTSGGVNGIYKSTDSGENFTKVNVGTPAGMLGYYTDGAGSATGQGSYDWCIAVKPDDANTVFIAGITTWKSTNGGVSFTANTCWTSHPYYNKSGVPVTHADKHALVYQTNSVLFEGNDGGIYKTTNGGSSWTDLSNGLVISQLYRIGVSQTSPTTTITGLQDNGSKLFSGGSWSDVTGGDGMECIVDYSNAQYMYATYVRGEIYRSTNNGVSFPTTISANIPGGQPTGAWVTPYIISPSNSSTLFAGYDKVWKTTDRGNTWTSASQVLSSSTKLRSLAIAPSNTNVLYTADRTNMWKTIDGGVTDWSSITLPTTANYVTYIAVKNNNPNTVWISYGGFTSGAKVYKSTDGGSSWSNISTGLPNLPVMCIIQYKDITDREILFAGTDVGVYIKDGVNDWASYNTGLPNVVVAELDIFYNSSGNDKLRAGTYGRGLWETEINAPLPVELVDFNASVSGKSITLNWSTATEVQNYGFDIERCYIDNVNQFQWEKIGFVEGNGNSNTWKEYSFNDKSISINGKYKYRLKQIDFNGSFEYLKETEVDVNFFNSYVLLQNHPNPFNPSTIIRYIIPVVSNGFQHVTLKIFDALGNEVAVLVNEPQKAGVHEVKFNSLNFSISSGIYFYRLSAGNFIQTKKMLLIK